MSLARLSGSNRNGWVAAHGMTQEVALRCRILLAAAAGMTNRGIAAECRVDMKTVALWRVRFTGTGPEKLREMAHAQGVSKSTISTIWRNHNPKPHRVKRFTLSRDARFLDQFTDVEGLYLPLPDQALGLCVDGKTQIQTQDRHSRDCS